MSNKDTRELIRKVKKAGGTVKTRRSGSLEVHGPRGFYLLHTSLKAGQPQDMTRRKIREYTGLEIK